MSYGTWLSGVVNNAKKKTEELVGGAIQTGQQVVQNTVNNAVNAGQQVVQNVASGYGDWVAQGQNVVNGAVQTGQQVATDYVNNTVIPAANQAVQTGQQAATDYYNNTVVPTVNQTVANAQEQATDYVNNTVVPTVNNAIGQGAQAVTDNVNNINGQVQAAVGNAPTEVTQPVTTPAAPTQGEGEHIYTYEEFTQSSTGNEIRDQNTINTDKQNSETLSELDSMKAVADGTTEGIYNKTNETLEGIKQDIYNYADTQLEGSLGYNQEAYQKIVDTITQQMEAGKLTAQEAKELILLAAEEAKNLTYASAERQRQEAEKMADIQRQRAIADANSAYEQNKTGYGAKAEAMGNMGLTGGGYSDWLDSAAYAQNRAETQAARAQSDTVKREARAAEEQTKLAADREKSDKELQAELDYLNRLDEIDTSYLANMSDAEQTKLAADKAAKDTAAGLKLEADTEYKKGMLENDTTYLGQLYQNIKDQSASDKEASEERRAYYELLMKGAANGTYNKEFLQTMAKDLGFDEEWTNALLNTADDYQNKVSSEESKAEADANVKNFAGFLDNARNGAYAGYTDKEIESLASELGITLNDSQKALIKASMGIAAGEADEADDKYRLNVYSELLMGAKSGAYTEAEIADFAERFGLDEGMTSNLTTAVKDYNTKVSNAEAEQNATNKTSNFVNMLNDVKNGAYTKDEIAEIASQLGIKAAEGEKGSEGYKENDQKLIDMLTKAADRYEAGVDEMDAATKTANFVDLLGMVNSGQLTKEEATEIAKQLGFDETADKTSLDLLNTAADRYASGTEEDKKAAKTTNFIALLDGANSGAYNSEQIAEIAAQLGFKAAEGEKGTEGYKENDQKLIDMLTKAADGFASEEAAAELKADKQYMNGLYAELLSAANNGDYDAEDIKDLASRFGFDEADQGKLAKAAEKYAKNKAAEKLELQKGASAENKLQIESTLTSDTTDDKIDEYVDAGWITEEDAEKLKVERNNVAKRELSDMIKGGDYAGAVERAEELYDNGKGYLDKDTYQKTYFESQKRNCSQVKTVDDVKSMEAELKNTLADGKISQADYDSLTKYMYESVGGKLNADQYTAELKASGMSVTANIQIGNTTYNSNLNKEADDDTISILNKIANSGDALVMLDGTLYFKSTLGWYSVKDKKGLYEAYNKQLSYQPKVKAPEHTVEKTKDENASGQNNTPQTNNISYNNSTSGSTGGGGGGNMMTRT